MSSKALQQDPARGKLWLVIQDDNEPHWRHVVPANDLRVHNTDYNDPTDCWCDPTVDPSDDGVTVHHSADKRELDEPGHIDYKTLSDAEAIEFGS